MLKRTTSTSNPFVCRLFCSAGLAALLLPGAAPSRSAKSVRFTQITASGVAEPEVPFPDLTYGTQNQSASISDAGDVAFISDADLAPKGSAPGAPGNADGSDELFLVRPDATLRQLTDRRPGGWMAGATISRDGSAIVFVASGALKSGVLPRVYLYRVASRQTLQLTENSGNYGAAAVSDRRANRHRVVFTQIRPTGPRLFTLEVTGGVAGKPVPLSGRPGRDPSISRDGQVIAFASGSRFDHQQIVLHAPGAGEKAITSGSEDSGRPAISADGRWIAFESRADLAGRNSDENREIFLYNKATGGVAQLTRTGAGVDNTAPTINRDGTRVAFVSNGDLAGRNSDHNPEIFLWIAGSPPSLRQITDTRDDETPAGNSVPYLIGSGGRLLFRSTANLDRRNADNSPEIFMASGL